MNKQKNQHSPVVRHQAGSQQKPVPVAVASVGETQKMVPNLSLPMPQEVKRPDQEEEVTKATLLLFEHIEEQIGRADTKAQLTLAADALLAGTLAALGKGAARSLLSNTLPVLDRFADLFTIFMFLALVCSFYWALRVINPHLRGSKRFTLMYFGRIAQIGRASCRERV